MICLYTSNVLACHLVWTWRHIRIQWMGNRFHSWCKHCPNDPGLVLWVDLWCHNSTDMGPGISGKCRSESLPGTSLKESCRIRRGFRPRYTHTLLDGSLLKNFLKIIQLIEILIGYKTSPVIRHKNVPVNIYELFSQTVVKIFRRDVNLHANIT